MIKGEWKLLSNIFILTAIDSFEFIINVFVKKILKIAILMDVILYCLTVVLTTNIHAWLDDSC